MSNIQRIKRHRCKKGGGKERARKSIWILAISLGDQVTGKFTFITPK